MVLKFLGEYFQGVLICDFWKVYNKLKALAKQRCFFHLYSEMEKVDARNNSEEWRGFRKKLYRLMKDSVRLWEKKGELQPDQFERNEGRFHLRLDKLIETEYSDKDCKRLRKRLKSHRDELFTFLQYDDVSPYNNHAEQQMRKPVLWRRRCQQNRSDRGVEAQAILMSIFRTAELQGLNPIDYIKSQAKLHIRKNHIKTNTMKNAA